LFEFFLDHPMEVQLGHDIGHGFPCAGGKVHPVNNIMCRRLLQFRPAVRLY
jgi:hypothetical protein